MTRNRVNKVAILVLGCLTAVHTPGLTQDTIIRCPASRDASISFHPKETRQTQGAASTMKIKYSEEAGLMDFDVRALKGRVIKECFLLVKAAGGHKFNLNSGTDLKWVSLSTVASEWSEPNVCADASGLATDWGWPGASAWDVTLGNAHTLRCNGTLEPTNGWHRLRLDPDLVSALVAGAAHGLFLNDGSTSYIMNCRIHSRESGNGPVLEVIVGSTDATPPEKLRALAVAPAARDATSTHGALHLELTGIPSDAFVYAVRVNGKPVPRWQIPLPQPGPAQTFTLVDLPPDSAAEVEICVIDRAGNVSAPVRAMNRTSPVSQVPPLPPPGPSPTPADPPRLDTLAVFAFPELMKINPVTGAVMHEPQGSPPRTGNPVWDAGHRRIRLTAARGEIVSFQIGVEGSDKEHRRNILFTPPHLKGPAGGIDVQGIRMWRNWYVAQNAEYALPLTEPLEFPAADNAIAGQTHQAVTIDIHVPGSTKPGDYAGNLRLSVENQNVELAIALRVFSAVIPDTIHFSPELNAYSGPGEAGSERFRDSFRLAHYHRCSINRVPYSQGGRVHSDWIPAIDAQGHVKDWSTFDRNLGGALDGSWFSDNPRSGVPVASLYLPLCEAWPVDFKRFYKPGHGAPLSAREQEGRVRHFALADPIEKALGAEFQTVWINSARAFYTHAAEKRWNRTVFECYLNNKSQYGYTLWTLDEPNIYRDWEALNFFATLFKRAIDDPDVYTPDWHRQWFTAGFEGMKRQKPTFLFRGDISRPQWQGTLSDGLMNIMYVGGGGFEMARTVEAHKRRMPCILFTYGSCSPHTESLWQNVAWCLKAYAHEYDGVVPWQSLGTGLNDPDPKGNGNALIVDGGPYGRAIASLRVHALRRGAQTAELLRLLQLNNGWTRRQMGMLVSRKIPLGGQFKPESTDEAAAIRFGDLPTSAFHELREGLLQMLESAATGP